MKTLGIITTGGDCSGLNTVIERVAHGAILRGWRVYGILDGTDGLAKPQPDVIEIKQDTIPAEFTHLAGSFLRNGHPNGINFVNAEQHGQLDKFRRAIRAGIRKLGLDALVLIGGNGSFSIAWAMRDVFSDVQLVCIPKTIDMDVPLTELTVGFETAVEQLTTYCDNIIMSARSHHRWFVVQSMGRDCGLLTLQAGIAAGANAILIPEIKFNVPDLISHIKKSSSDYGIILVSEGISLRGHSGRPADMISRELDRAGIPNRTAFPEHIQRGGYTCANDRILASQFASCALDAIENNETYVMVSLSGYDCKTVSLDDFMAAGHKTPDPNNKKIVNSVAHIEPGNSLLHLAEIMGIYIGNKK